jgi:acetylornithine/succinyldiaminopimelate/putrescine aminotransferase
MSLLSRLVDVRKDETATAWLMFAYAYLAMTAYNIIQPLTRSKLIASLGAINVPWVIFGSGLFIGVELVRDQATLEPAAAEADHVANRMREEGILLGTDGSLHNVLKIRPPMPFNDADGDRLLETLDRVLGELDR